MTTFEKIITAIQPFGYPYAQDVYVGESDHWFTYNYVSDYGDLYSDNEPAEIVVSVQVHLYLPLIYRIKEPCPQSNICSRLYPTSNYVPNDGG